MSAPLVVVMGISGVGKSAVGQAVAQRAGVPYMDGDDFHSRQNIEKMAAGEPLTDDDRWPWLERVGEWLAEHAETGGVIACSALRRVYRDLLTQHAPSVVFLHLVGDHDLIRSRMAGREGHFMPGSLLGSQEATLEDLEPDENGVALGIVESPEQIAATFMARLVP